MIVTLIKQTLASGEDVKLSGFGSFIVRDKKARTGQNPKTGEPMTIEARGVVRFKPSQMLRGAVLEKANRR